MLRAWPLEAAVLLPFTLPPFALLPCMLAGAEVAVGEATGVDRELGVPEAAGEAVEGAGG